jgi:hypothetical protein
VKAFGLELFSTMYINVLLVKKFITALSPNRLKKKLKYVNIAITLRPHLVHELGILLGK